MPAAQLRLWEAARRSLGLLQQQLRESLSADLPPEQQSELLSAISSVRRVQCELRNLQFKVRWLSDRYAQISKFNSPGL
jgi:hypothetical protein